MSPTAGKLAKWKEGASQKMVDRVVAMSICCCMPHLLMPGLARSANSPRMLPPLPWCVICVSLSRSGMESYIQDGWIECWIPRNGREQDAAHSNFWRISPSGEVLLIRAGGCGRESYAWNHL
jgi:hypothetical protein